jgi:hypothetical protein
LSFTLSLQSQVSFSKTLGSYRYDRLFDYGKNLDDMKGKAVVVRYFDRLNQVVEPLLAKRNKLRLTCGHLTFPYLLPKWVPNGVQT